MYVFKICDGYAVMLYLKPPGMSSMCGGNGCLYRVWAQGVSHNTFEYNCRSCSDALLSSTIYHAKGCGVSHLLLVGSVMMSVKGMLGRLCKPMNSCKRCR